jgi:hypothetical protein
VRLRLFKGRVSIFFLLKTHPRAHDLTFVCDKIKLYFYIRSFHFLNTAHS